MDNPLQPPTLLSLCTGGGMLDEGVERALGPVHTVAYVEIEAFALWNLVSKMEAGLLAPAPCFTDIKTFPAAAFHRKICGIIGGYPCQPFSHAGQRKGTDDERHLWPHIRNIIDAVKPLWCFFENVPGHLTLGYDEVYRSLADMGYAVEAGLFSAAEVGAPHERERLFILAMADSENSGCQGEFKQWQRLGFSKWKFHQCQEEGRDEIRGGIMRHNEGGSMVVHSHRTRQQQPQGQQPQSRGWLAHDGEAMGNAKHRRCQQRDQEQRKIQQPDTRCEQAMDNATSLGIQRAEPARAASANGPLNESRFPSPPGHPQHLWEAPRVEPGMGFSAHGYNFREDLLRMAGNGVVPQTAALAFRTLMDTVIE